MYGADAQTGEAVVDRVIHAVLLQDLGTLEGLVVYEQPACSTSPTGIDGPGQCPRGARDGTAVSSVRGGSCEGYWITIDQTRSSFEDFVSGGPLFLFAVTRNTPATEALRRKYGDVLYSLVFASSPDRVPARTILASKSGIIDIERGCSADAREVVARASDFLLAPNQ
jgi:hypothetical protein